MQTFAKSLSSLALRFGIEGVLKDISTKDDLINYLVNDKGV